MNAKLYDALKFLALILLPALGTLYFSFAGIWGLPAAEQVVGSIVSFDAFLGVLLGVSSHAYNKSDAKYDGSLELKHSRDTGKTTYTLVLNNDPDYTLEGRDEIIFKINKDAEEAGDPGALEWVARHS